MLGLSTGRHPSARLRAAALGLSVVTVGGGLVGVLPVEPVRAASTIERESSLRIGRFQAPSQFVPPTADAGDDQSVPEGTVVTLDATESTSSNLVTRTYTTSADFAEGTSINLTDTPPDQLRLDDTTEAFAFIWIAASSRGTVVKIDTETGEILGEYWSAPQNRSKDPSRTTVDHNGNVWVGNRAEGSSLGGVARGSVTQVGLLENGQCVDRNGNGTIETSTGRGDIRPWPNSSGVDTNGGVETAADECILTYVRTNGVAIRQVSVDAENHVWVGGAAQGNSPSFFDRLAPDGTIVRSINMRAPAQTGESGVVVCCYGGLVDPAGILWSSSGSNNLVRLDPSFPNGHADLIRNIGLGRTSYGLGIDPGGFLWQSNWTSNTVMKISPAGAILNTFGTSGGNNDRGVAVTADGDVWVANSAGDSVSRLRNNGSLVTVIGVGNEPTGVAVDAAGKVWATNLQSSTASRINPATNTVDLTVSLGSGAGPYNYSDMTGATLTGAPDDGTWSVVYDSEADDTAWAYLDWNAQLSGDGAFSVTVASSDDGVTFGPEVAVSDAEEISGLDTGRYLRITARFTRATSGESPVLFDLTVAHAGDRANTLAYSWRLVDIDGPPIFLSSATSPTPSFVAPDDGSYTFELTVTDSAGLSDTDEVTVGVTNLDPAVEADIGSAFARGVTLVNASFTDPGWLDTHSATFNWGDGSPVEAVSVTAQGTGWGSFFGSHVYAAAGTFTVSLTLTDDDGGSDTFDLGQVGVAEPVAVWANSTSAAKTIEWTGSGGTITGRVHSNREVKIAGTLPKSIIGPTEYATSIQVQGPHTVTPVQMAPQTIPVIYNLADYAPGGPVSIQVGAAYFNHAAQCVGGLWDVGSQTLPVGVHYAPCSVKLNGASIAGRVTLAATGAIELSGSNPAFEPYHDGLLLLAGSSGKKAINVSASSSKFLGVIYARFGEVSLSGSNSKYFCGIFGNTVSMSGSNLVMRAASCGRPDSTISGPLLVPGLALSLAADPDETLPGGDIAYDLEVSNDGAQLIVPGLLGLENVDTASATVTGVTYAFEYFSLATQTWIPIASLADGTVALTPHANPSPGVTYPAPDQILGTVVGPGGFATWGYQALVDLTPAQVNLLLDPAQVGGFRNRVDFTLNPSTVQVRRLFTFGTDFIAALRALTGDVTNPSVTFLPPAGDLVVADATTNPALAILSPGETVTFGESFAVPVAAPRSPTETDAGYIARLLVLDGSLLIGSSFALAEGGVGKLVAPLVSATTTERLPVVSLATTGPDSMPSGTTAQYDLGIANQGSAAAPSLALTATAAGDPRPVAGAPSALAAGQVATATTTYTAPDEDAPADVTVAGTLTWSDADGNGYGPVGSSKTTQILAPATLSAILVDTLLTDVSGDGQVSPGDTVRYTLTISNQGGQPLTNVVASVPPDPNSALVVGSVAAPGGTVTSGNDAGDTTAGVTYPSIAAGGTASFTFDATVDDPFPSGTSAILAQGAIEADGFDPVLSDDPAFLGLANPTRTTVVVPTANLIVSLDDRLLLDPDGNGFPSAGDTLRYELVVASAGSLTVNGVVVTVPTPTGTSLVPGSIATTTGTVTGPGVAIDVGSLPFLSAATITFEVLIASPLPAGQTAITAQGTVASDELADLLTDDPRTEASPDATVTTVGSAGGGGGGGGVPGVPGPSIGTISPAEGTTITEAIDIATTLTPPAGETVTAWTVGYRLEGDSNVSQLAAGSGPTVAATIDPTVLPNGAYVIVIRAEGSAGGVSIAETRIVVEGQLKLGRYVTTYQDLSVGVAGLPLQVLRTYDSFDKTNGDFGIGWTVELANFRVSTNGPLGQGGWRMFGCGGGIIFVPLCFESDKPHYVTVTWPDGRVETFDLTPAKGSTFLSGLTSAQFTARPRTTSKLEAVDSSLYWSNGDLLGGFFGSGGVYDPQRFRLTASNGTVYLLDRTAGLLSATDRNGDTLTVTPNGIVSSRGPSITFSRDALGRITQVVGPESETLVYTYDAAGDLKTVEDPNDRVVTYEYEAGHYLVLTRDPLNRPFQTLTYEDGRLTAVTDALGNEVTVEVDPDARTETVLDAAGRLTTISTFDERGNVVERRDVYDGRTSLTTFTYDEFDNVETRTDPEGHTWTGVWDEQNLRFFTDPTGKTTEIRYDDFGYPTVWKEPRGGETVYGWDTAGHLASVRDALTRTETHTYDGAGNRDSRTDRNGHVWQYTYFPDGLVETAEDPLGHVTSYTYDDSGRLLTMTDPTNRVTGYTYWPDGNIKTRTDPGGLVTSYTYDELGNLETMTDQAGKTTTWHYDAAARVQRVVDPLGKETLLGYDANGRLETETAPDGGITRYTYDGAGRVASVMDPVGRVTTYAYDLAGRLVSSTNPSDGVTEYEYDDAGRLLLKRDPLGNETEHTYDDDGNIETVTDPLDHLTRYEFNLAGRVTRITDASGGVTRFGYDNIGRITTSTNPEDETLTSVYDQAGRLVIRRDGLGHETTYGYDDAGRLLTTEDALGHTETRAYDAAGRLESVTTASGIATSYTYDPRGMVATVRNTLGHTTTYTYDDAGRLATVRDPRNFTTTYTYDDVGRLKTMKDAKDATITLGYNLAGEQTSITDPRGKVWQATYDVLGGLKTATDPLGRTRSRDYDDAGRLSQTTDARGVVALYDHDAAGNLDGISAGGLSITYTQDELNRRRTMSSAVGTTTWSYDGASRVTSVAAPAGTVGYTYDDAGRRTTMTLPGGTATYDYFDDDRVSAVTGIGGSFAFTYFADGRPQSITRPNGVTTTDGYDAAGRLTSVTHTRGGSTLASFTYTLDASGNRTSMTSSAGTETYTINELNQLTRVALPGGAVTDYAYDPAGNPTTKTTGGVTTTSTFDDASQLVSVGGASFSYDAAGNRLTGGGATYTWDELGRLASATVGGTTTTYTLDGDGRRVAATTGGTTTPYLWDRVGTMANIVSDGSATYLRVDGSLLAQASAASAVYPLTDALGSVRTITDPAGAVVGTASYDPFGTTTGQTGATSPFGFTGELRDPAGIYLRARTYDPAARVFLSVDPVRPGTAGVVGYNPYTYVGSNPTTLTDPSGAGLFAYASITAKDVAVIGGLALLAGCIALCDEAAQGIAGLILRFVEILREALPRIEEEEEEQELPDNIIKFPKNPNPNPRPEPPPIIDIYPPIPNPKPDDRNPCKDQPAGQIAYGPLHDERTASGAVAQLTWVMLDTGTAANPNLEPPGWLGGDAGHNRSHLIAKRLGGRGDIYENIVTMHWRPNQVTMRGHEAEVYAAVAACELVTYSVVPNYLGTGSLPVTSVTMAAVGNRGFVRNWIVENEPGG
ncbi:MAG TPA: RHS repeat-associated core domain-containing protein [Candidatus Limnocylindrales bacterium]|nr:RHS repeat-associated core domain-containing protein [Candidatus Limnocylindrales bacterium]